jgi:hypothetical protein
MIFTMSCGGLTTHNPLYNIVEKEKKSMKHEYMSENGK